MSQTDDSHWRDPPKDRVDPDYPPHLTIRFEHVNYGDCTDPERDGKTIVYDNSQPDERWVQGVAMPLDSML